MDIQGLLEIKEVVLKNYKQFNMYDWFTDNLLKGTKAHKEKGVSLAPANCGTAACFAGWHVTNLVRKENPTLRLSEAKEIRLCSVKFRLATDSFCQEDLKLPNSKLFWLSSWPIRFSHAYEQALERKQFKKAAKIAGEVIDDYIATGGWIEEVTTTTPNS